MNWKLWIYSLASAVIGGASNAVLAMVIDPAQFNLETGMKKVSAFACLGALFSGASFLKQTPLPSIDKK